MLRASLILGLFVASVAGAAPAEWTLPPLPADWKDVTEAMMKEPSMAAQKEIILKAGGTFAGTVYASEAGGGAIMVVTSVFADSSTVIAELEGFMEGSRKRAAQNAKELSWKLERTDSMLVSTQRVDNQGVPITGKTFIGYLENDALRAIAFLCFGPDDVCGPLIDKVKVDATGLQPLAKLDANKKKMTPYRIGMLVGSVLTLIFILGALWKRRPRAPR